MLKINEHRALRRMNLDRQIDEVNGCLNANRYERVSERSRVPAKCASFELRTLRKITARKYNVSAEAWKRSRLCRSGLQP